MEPRAEHGSGSRPLRGSSPLIALGPWLLVALAFALFATVATAQRAVEVYKVQYRVAEELLPLAQAVIGASGSATVDRNTNSLVLIGDPRDMAETLALLAKQDRRPRTIVLHYDTTRLADLSAQGFDVRWTAEAGDFRMGNVRRPRGSGSSLDVRAKEDMRKLDESLTGTLRITEGSSARIETGTSIPYTTVGPNGTNTEFVDATTGFAANARILGDGRVQVDLASFAGQLLGRDGQIARTNASTLVILTPGDTVVVGGIGQSGAAKRSEALSGRRSKSASDETLLMLRAEIE